MRTLNIKPDAKAILDLIQKIHQLSEDSLGEMGYDLVRVLFTGQRRKTLQVMIERRDGTGITVDDCTKVSNHLSVLLDVNDVISSAYDLEVSSAGLERPLTKLADYQRFCGQKAVVKTTLAIEGCKRFTGTITSARDNQVHLSLRNALASGATDVEIPLDAISSAHLYIEY